MEDIITHMEDIDYEEDVRIDPDALDVEWIHQADLMRKYSRHAANMKYYLDSAKERLDITKAYVEMRIRDNPGNYGLSKVTESAIQSALILTTEYQEASKEYNEARYEYETAMAAVRAIDQRKTALENLVKLLSLSYFAGPIAPRNLQQENIKRAERKQHNAKVKIQRRKKE